MRSVAYGLGVLGGAGFAHGVITSPDSLSMSGVLGFIMIMVGGIILAEQYRNDA